MSDFMQVINQVGTIAGQVANVVGQVTGRTPSINPGATPPYYQQPGTAASYYPQPGPMAQDRVQWSPGAYPAPTAPAQPPAQTAPAPGGFMQVMSALFSKIASFFRQLFGGAGSAPVGTAPVGTVPAVPMADAREQLFSMFPSGQGTVLGFVPVGVTRYADRIVASAGSFGQAAIVKYQGDYLFYENSKPPVKVSNVVSSRTATGDMHFDVTLENGKRIGADILADGHTIRYDRYTLTLR